jgi:hypothetical protein
MASFVVRNNSAVGGGNIKPSHGMVTFAAGETAHLTCIAPNDTAAEWRFLSPLIDATTIFTENHTTCRRHRVNVARSGDDAVLTLEIVDLQPVDTGEYRCTDRNGQPPVYAAAYIKVYGGELHTVRCRITHLLTADVNHVVAHICQQLVSYMQQLAHTAVGLSCRRGVGLSS